MAPKRKRPSKSASRGQDAVVDGGSSPAVPTEGGPAMPSMDAAKQPHNDTARTLKQSRDGASRRSHLDVLVADNVAPGALGIVAMQLSRNESLVVTARSNGSLALYRVLPGPDPQKPIFNFVMISNTGGHAGVTIAALCFLGECDEFIAVSLWSGHLVLYQTDGLRVVSVSPRLGGVARAIDRWNERLLFAACADGSARGYALSDAGDELRCVVTLPKSPNAQRALCVATNAAAVGGGLIVVGDDARSLTAFRWSVDDDAQRSIPQQQWAMALQNAYPMCVAINAVAVAVGTSMNEVLFIDPVAGLIVNSYQHHKGPVTVIVERAGVFYASGWHESLRAYRCARMQSETHPSRAAGSTHAGPACKASDYVPADVKRRTHYHECTALAVGPTTGLFMSASLDGTILFTNLSKLFTHPPSYFDTQSSTMPHALAASGQLLFTHSDTALLLYRVTPELLVPLTTVSFCGTFNIRGMWVNPSGTRVAVAMDDRFVILGMSVNLENNTCTVLRMCNEAVPEVSAACFISDDTACVASGRAILVVDCRESTARKVATAASALHAARRKRAMQHRKPPPSVEADAVAATTAIVQVYTHPRIASQIQHLVPAVSPTQWCVFVSTYSTRSPAACHFVRFAEVPQAGGAGEGEEEVQMRRRLIDPPTVAAIDCIMPRPLQGPLGEVAFLCPSDGRHWVAQAPLSLRNDGSDIEAKKPLSLTQPRALLPQNAVVLGRYPEHPTIYTAAFPGGVIRFQGNGERWSYIRPVDRAKTAPNAIKCRTEYASFVPNEAKSCTRTTSKRPPRAEHPPSSPADPDATEGDSDADGAAGGEDDNSGSAAAAATLFVLRRHVEGILDALPPMWRVRRFGN